MQVKTWLQRLTDESNLWFNAVKAEDEGDFGTAVLYYIKDASECAKQQSLVRVALSCSCAANCLARMGAGSQARTLYGEAGSIYVKNSDVAISESIREALWSLQEAYENFALAGDFDAADMALNRYIALAARTNPFSKTGQAIKALESRKVTPVNPAKEVDIPDKLTSEIDSFMKARKAGAKTEDFDPKYVMKAIKSGGGSRLDEKSIAS